MGNIRGEDGIYLILLLDIESEVELLTAQSMEIDIRYGACQRPLEVPTLVVFSFFRRIERTESKCRFITRVSD